MKYAFVRQQARHHSIQRLCLVLGVSASGYYDWRDRPESMRAKANRRLTTKIRYFHKASGEIYGSPRIHKDLRDVGEEVGVNRVAKRMRREAIQSKMAKKFVITTDSRNTLQPAPDRLRRCFKVANVNHAWVSDTTCIRTRQG